MINNQKCVSCEIFDICKAAAKLKAFTDEARVDLGVTLDFQSCENYRDLNDSDCESDEEASNNN